MIQRKKARKTTIYDLAELTGASATAVSSVLNGNWKKRRISAQLAEKIARVAQEQGYAPNKQASVLRSQRSHIIGMIVPKYDNRYFGSIVERFEAMARARGLFPIVTCTRRDPALELEAAQTMLSWQVDWVIATGATDPDKISELCAAVGVPTLNLDLPGKRAPSVISDNYGGARALTRRVLENVARRMGEKRPLVFVGGRGSDHNTRERLRGFSDAHREYGLPVQTGDILTCGYAPEKAASVLSQYAARHQRPVNGLFVNSTISLEGVMRWMDSAGLVGERQLTMGCFDWDPFVSLLGHDIEMMKQNVPAMLDAVFALIDSGGGGDTTLIEVPPLFVHQP
ncbi:substrate-binding domain-containing protein [Pantoea sp. 1.19]|uniref:LacI family DNA-binding transcriptional regulator n=1 Tax=Pantoea sp. 1.19 TaxID=1925589 RepID=UPI0009488F86|nr:substrate-binding domain-containing protein [Pantoea sp. 1.19]